MVVRLLKRKSAEVRPKGAALFELVAHQAPELRRGPRRTSNTHGSQALISEKANRASAVTGILFFCISRYVDDEARDHECGLPAYNDSVNARCVSDWNKSSVPVVTFMNPAFK